jgi:IMP dehydrogenase/GMP reductase
VGLTHSASTWEAYLPRIRQIAPGLVIETVTLNADGMANEVVIVNGEVAFRFAKGEFGVQSLRRELQALAALPAGLAVAIPQPFYTGEDVMAYRFLPGEALTRHRLLGLPPARQQTIASQLGEFLQVMHAMQDPALSATAAPVDVERFRSQHERARQVVYPLLLPHQVAWAEQVYGFLDQPEAFEYTPALIHGDLAPYHILYDPDRQRLSGVIDFGVAGLGDPMNEELFTAFEALTFDDVLVVPGYAEVLPDQTEVSAQLTPHIRLNIPILSAAMDTVTEARLAIALAREGGIGIIHRNLSPAAQAAEVDKVKRSQSGMIVEPITLPPDALLKEAESIMSTYHISGVPMVDHDGKLVGILTNRDIRFVERRITASRSASS